MKSLCGSRTDANKGNQVGMTSLMTVVLQRLETSTRWFPLVCQDVHARMSASSFATERASPGARVVCALLLRFCSNDGTWTSRSCRPITSSRLSSLQTVSHHLAYSSSAS